ncbi:MAG TPA: cation diffusion facilitator family transporter, partial [Chitinophagales bacterium]
VKWLAGTLGNSYALIADAIESTSDVFSPFLVLFGLKYSSRPADENHPYGHGRAEPLITFLVVGFLGLSATVIAYNAIENIRTPHELPKPFTLWVLGIVILVKELIYRFAQKRGKESNSSSIKADAFHHRSDALTSLAAFIGIAFALFMGKGYESADDWAALFASAIILYNSYHIFRPALGEIMDEHLYDDLVAEIRKIAITVSGVIDTEKCLVRKVGMNYHIDLHIHVNADISVKEGHDIAHRLKEKLMNQIPEIADVLIHVEPDDERW